MLQRDHLLDWRTIEGNIMLGLEVKRMATPENRAYALFCWIPMAFPNSAIIIPGSFPEECGKRSP